MDKAEKAADESHEGEAACSELARKFFSKKVDFMLSVARLEQLPLAEVPEIAFFGRSNVGKSSLINALFNQRELARTSNTPGRTQQLNFFSVEERLRIVDLPGYGFAKAPLKQIEEWQELATLYLKGRPNLKLCCLLIDCRRGIKPVDEPVMELFKTTAVPFMVTLTKSDYLRQGALLDLVQSITVTLKNKVAALPEPAVTSVKDKKGIANLREVLAAYALPEHST